MVKNRQFDSMIRQRIEMEVFYMSKCHEENLKSNQHRSLAHQMVRRYSLRSILAAALILALASGAALATIRWNSRQLITYIDEKGQEHVNEALVEMSQPIAQVFEGQSLRVNMIDAICDGRSLVLTWSLENKQEEGDLFLLLENTGELFNQGLYSQTSEVFISPGEIISSGVSTIIDAPLEEESVLISFSYAVLEPLGEIVEVDGLDWSEPAIVEEAYMRNIDELNAQGKLVIAPDGSVQLGSYYPENYEESSYSGFLIAAGKMKHIETVDVAFSIKNNAQVINLLPDGMPVEKDNGDYILRVTKAELSTDCATFNIERVSANEDAVEHLKTNNSDKLGPFWEFDFPDEENSNWYVSLSGVYHDPVAAAENTWVWAYELYLTPLQRMPESITVVPRRENPETGEMTPYPDEAIALKVP
jgi:hypothetical protein